MWFHAAADHVALCRRWTVVVDSLTSEVSSRIMVWGNGDPRGIIILPLSPSLRKRRRRRLPQVIALVRRRWKGLRVVALWRGEICRAFRVFGLKLKARLRGHMARFPLAEGTSSYNLVSLRLLAYYCTIILHNDHIP